MAAPTPPQKTRGLPAIDAARAERAARRFKLTPGMGFVAAGVLLAVGVIYKVVNDRDVEVAKGELLTKQETQRSSLGEEWFQLREKLEADILESAKGPKDDHVNPSLAKFDFRTRPGIYLRLRLAEATDAEHVRAVAAEARKDYFAGCLIRPREGAKPDAGAFPEQPWNLGQAYAATKVLNEPFAQQVKEADNLIRLRVLTKQWEEAAKRDISLATRLVQGSEYFLLVLDEDVPEALAYAQDGGIDEAALQLVPHPARVFVFNLRGNEEKHKLVLRLTRVGSATHYELGQTQVIEPEVEQAMQRNVNNCALAQQVRTELPGERGAE